MANITDMAVMSFMEISGVCGVVVFAFNGVVLFLCLSF